MPNIRLTYIITLWQYKKSNNSLKPIQYKVTTKQPKEQFSEVGIKYRFKKENQKRDK
jgi:hypothetical protein